MRLSPLRAPPLIQLASEPAAGYDPTRVLPATSTMAPTLASGRAPAEVYRLCHVPASNTALGQPVLRDAPAIVRKLVPSERASR